MKVVNLKTNHAFNPVGVDGIACFSWMLESETPNTFQTAYRLMVQDSEGKQVWDTGICKSDRTSYIEYAGEPLVGRMRYIWRVTVWDNYGNSSAESAFFEMALLRTEDWQAKWVRTPRPSPGRKKGFGNQPPATMFRKGFTLKATPVRARLYATCLGVYRLTINGVRPDYREFAPEHTSYRKYVCYQTYDVTALLKEEKNVIGMYVGDGWYCCPQTQPPIDGLKPDHTILFQLEVTYPDGTEDVVVSDTDVKTSEGAVRHSDLFDGEKYDATLEEPWDTPVFDDSSWRNAVVYKQDFDVLHAQIGEPVRPVVVLPAKRVYASCKGETIVDFGQVIAGRTRVRIDVPYGTEVTLEHFETTDKDGSYYNNVISAMGTTEQKDVYISNGNSAVYEPMFTYHGFRYIRVTGMPDPKPEDFLAVALSSDMQNVGDFSCSDERLNRLYENVRWSQRSNMISIPTDCPTREKAGWTGDILVYAKASMLNEDTTPFLTRWLENLACDQRENGSVPYTVPDTSIYHYSGIKMGEETGCGGPVTSSGWGDAAVSVPYTMYEMTGNDIVLRKQYNSMKAWCDYIISRAKIRRPGSTLPDEIETYLWNTGFQFGEWLIPSTESASQQDVFEVMAKSSIYTAPIFGWYSCNLMAQIAEKLGQTSDAAYYRDISAKMKNAIQEGLIDKNGNMPAERMGAYVLAIVFDLVPQQHKKHFADKLVELIHENGDRLDTGFLTTPYLLDALCLAGRLDMAYTLLFQEKSPSWMSQVNAGATSIWESWEMYQPDGTPKNASFNHYAFGCVVDWMFRYIGGIDQKGVGYRHLIFHPQPEGRLTWAKRSYITEHGLALCNWRREDETFILEIRVPCNTSATVIMPDATTKHVGSGHYVFKSSYK